MSRGGLSWFPPPPPPCPPPPYLIGVNAARRRLPSVPIGATESPLFFCLLSRFWVFFPFYKSDHLGSEQRPQFGEGGGVGGGVGTPELRRAGSRENKAPTVEGLHQRRGGATLQPWGHWRRVHGAAWPHSHGIVSPAPVGTPTPHPAPQMRPQPHGVAPSPTEIPAAPQRRPPPHRGAPAPHRKESQGQAMLAQLSPLIAINSSINERRRWGS